MKFMGVTPQGNGVLELHENPLGKGGEGSVYAVKAHNIPGLPPADKLVAKTYHDPEEGDRRAKIRAMMSAPVSDKAVAWPQALVFTQDKQFQGYLMMKLDTKSNREWLYLANAKERNKIAPDFDTRYAIIAVRNLAAALLAVHQPGHKIGDINESNIFLRADASVLMVDSDSMQIVDASGEVYPCTVGKPEYTAPELSHGSLRDNPRTLESDLFAFAVASYQLLTGGATPHQGSFDPNDPDDPLSVVERIRVGVLPSLAPDEAKLFGFSARPGVPVKAFPGFLSKTLIAFLAPEPEKRNTQEYNLDRLIRFIDAYAPKLVRCSKEKLHWHQPGETCGWCESSRNSGIDPWASETMKEAPAQLSLPPVSFGENNSSSAPAKRAPAAVAGQQAHQANQQASGAAPADPLLAMLNSSDPQVQAAAVAYLAGNQGAQQAPTKPRPKKIKGKVTVEYADGSWGVRPPLGQLMRSSKKIAFWAIKEETPGILKFWWPTERNVGNLFSLILGFIFSLALVYTNYSTAYALLNQFDFMGATAVLVGALIPTVTSLFAVVFLFIAGFKDRTQAKKQGLSNFKEENPLMTIFRFFMVAVFYGIPAATVAIFGGLFTFIRAAVRA